MYFYIIIWYDVHLTKFVVSLGPHRKSTLSLKLILTLIIYNTKAETYPKQDGYIQYSIFLKLHIIVYFWMRKLKMMTAGLIFLNRNVSRFLPAIPVRNLSFFIFSGTVFFFRPQCAGYPDNRCYTRSFFSGFIHEWSDVLMQAVLHHFATESRNSWH